MSETPNHLALTDFIIGMDFTMSGRPWRCVDVGSRFIVAIKLDHQDDPSWYDGPPYAVETHALGIDDFPACYRIGDEEETPWP